MKGSVFRPIRFNRPDPAPRAKMKASGGTYDYFSSSLCTSSQSFNVSGLLIP